MLDFGVTGAGVCCGQDMNRVKDKPYTAAVEDEGRPDHVSCVSVWVCELCEGMCLCVSVCASLCQCVC